MNLSTGGRRATLAFLAAALAFPLLMIAPTPAAAASAAMPELATMPELALNDPLPATPADPWQGIDVGYQPVPAVTALDSSIARNTAVRVGVATSLGIPLYDVDAVALRVRVRGASATSGVTVWGSGGRPANPTILVPRSADRTQLVIVALDSAGDVRVRSDNSAVNATIDLVGYVPDASSFRPVTPARVRNGATASVVRANATTTVRVTGTGDIPTSGVGAVALNVSVVASTAATAVTAYASNATRPAAPDLAAPASTTGLSTTTIVPVGPDGRIVLHNAAGNTRISVDVVGWFAADGDLRSLARTTLRSGAAAADSITNVPLASTVPAGTGAAVIAIRTTATSATTVTAFPAGTPRPTQPTTVAGAGRGETLAVLPLGSDGSIDVHTTGPLADLSVDVLGTFALAQLPPEGSTWQFDPLQWANLAAAGQSRTVNLVNIGADGRPTGAYLPAGTTWAVAGDTSAVTVTVLGRGRARVVGTATIGSVAVVATPVVGLQGMPMVVKRVNLQPGVRLIQDANVVFPDRTQPNGGSPAPFTLAELDARLVMPAEDTPDPFNAGARVPAVLRGRAPAVGTILAAAGNSAVSGRVVAPDGLPNLNRGGMSLVSIELLSPVDVYLDLRYDVDTSVGRAIGGQGTVTAEQVAIPKTFLPRPVVTAAPQGLRNGILGIPKDCEGELSIAGKTEFKLLSLERPTAQIPADWKLDIANGASRAIEVTTGFVYTGKAEISLTAQAEIKTAFECRVALLGMFEEPTPQPELLTVPGIAEIVLAGEIAVPFGPKAEFKYGCEWSIDKQRKIRADTAGNVTVTNLSDTATVTCKPDASFAPTILPTKVEAKFGLYATVTAGGRIGGEEAAFVARLVDRPDLGVVKVLKAKVGEEVKFTWETDQQVLSAGKSESKVVRQQVAEGEIDMPDLMSAFSRFKIKIGPQVAIKLFESTLVDGGLFRVPGDPTLVVTVNGEVRSGPIVSVERGDQVHVESTMKFPNIGPMLVPDTPIEGGTDWIESAPGTWSRFNVFTSAVSSPAPALAADATIAPVDCVTLQEPKKIAFLTDSRMLGVAPTAGWAGSITLHCPGPSLRFDPDSVHFRPFETGGAVRTVQLRSEYAKGLVWSMLNQDEIPAWLTVSNRTGRFEASPDAAGIQLQVDCDVLNGPGGSAVLSASVGDPLGRTATAYLSVSAECGDEYIRTDPSVLRGGGSVNVVTDGNNDDRWTIGNVPDWITPSLRFKDLDTSLSSQQVSLSVARRTPSCKGVQPERRAEVTFTTGARGTAKVLVIDPEVGRASPCPIIGASGDPHLATADGLRFDAQVVGEYTYATSASGEFVLQARHEASSPFVAGPVIGSPTSVTAVALRTGGSTIEVYADRAPGDLRLRIDGTDVVVDPAAPLAVTELVSVAYTADPRGARGGTYVITGPDGVLMAHQWGAILDVTFDYADARGDVTGLLGAPDGNPGNDLVPRGTAAGFTIDQVYGHTPALYTLTDSWRTTDPDASLFTVAYDGFDDANWPMDSAALAPYRAQVVAALGSITSVCGGATPGLGDYVVEALALELSIGTPLGDLGRFTCTYLVTANTLTEGDGYPVPGVSVMFDAPGLQPCNAVSGVDGAATCRLAVALDELGGTIDPFEVTATANWPGGTEVLDTTTIPIDQKAALDGTPLAIAGDLTIPVTLPAVAITGTLRNDITTPTSWTFRLTARNAAGEVAGTRVATVTPDVDGTYALTLNAPPPAVDVDIDVVLGDGGADRHVITGLVPGATTPATIDVDDRAVRVRIDGSVLYNGAPAIGTPGSPSLITVTERDAGGEMLDFRIVDPQLDPDTGAYELDLALRSRTRSIDVIASVATPLADRRILVSGRFEGLVSGANPPLVFDAIVAQPRLVVSGTARVGGAPASDHFAAVLMYGADGTQVGGQVVAVDVDATTGAYSIEPNLDQRTVRATVRFLLGAIPSEYPTIEVADLSPGVLTQRTLDFDLGQKTLTVSGTIRFGGQPVLPGSELDVRLVPYGSDGQPIGATGPFGPLEFGQRPNTTAGGTYTTIALSLPAGTVEVRGVVSISGVKTAFTTPILPGANQYTVDVDTVQVVLHGRYELRHDGTVFVNVTTPVFGPPTHQGQTAFHVDEGTYSVTFQLPAGSTEARLSIVFGSDSIVVTDLQPGSNDRTHDFVLPATVRITGAVTRTQVLADDLDTASLVVRAYHENADRTFELLSDVEYGGISLSGGTFTIDVPVPPETNLVDLAATSVGPVDYARLGAQRVDPGGSIDVRIEIERWIDVVLTYSDVAPECVAKVRDLDAWIVSPDAGTLIPNSDGYPAPAIWIGTTLLVPDANLNEVVRLPWYGFWSYAFYSHGDGEPAASLQTAPIAAPPELWSVDTNRSDNSCIRGGE